VNYSIQSWYGDLRKSITVFNHTLKILDSELQYSITIWRPQIVNYSIQSWSVELRKRIEFNHSPETSERVAVFNHTLDTSHSESQYSIVVCRVQKENWVQRPQKELQYSITLWRPQKEPQYSITLWTPHTVNHSIQLWCLELRKRIGYNHGPETSERELPTITVQRPQ
jgi:hypothetical protein